MEKSIDTSIFWRVYVFQRFTHLVGVFQGSQSSLISTKYNSLWKFWNSHEYNCTFWRFPLLWSCDESQWVEAKGHESIFQLLCLTMNVTFHCTLLFVTQQHDARMFGAGLASRCISLPSLSLRGLIASAGALSFTHSPHTWPLWKEKRKKKRPRDYASSEQKQCFDRSCNYYWALECRVTIIFLEK